MSQGADQAGIYSVSLISVAGSGWEYSTPPPPLDGLLVHHRVTPSIKLASTHLYTRVEKDFVRVFKCPWSALATRTSQSEDECSKHKATGPP